MTTEKDTPKPKKEKVSTKNPETKKTATKTKKATESTANKKEEGTSCEGKDCCQVSACCLGAILKNFVCKTITISKDPTGGGLVEVTNEDNDNQSLYLKYIIPGLLIAALASFLSSIFFNNESYPAGFFATFYTIVIEVLAGGGIFIIAALVLAKVSEYFEGKKDFNTALKVLTFVFLPYLLASVVKFVPSLWLVTCLVGAYCLYLFYVAFEKVLSVNKDKQPLAFVANLFALVVVGLLLNIIVNFITPSTIEDYKQAFVAKADAVKNVLEVKVDSRAAYEADVAKDKEIDAAIELLQKLKKVN